jgi:hypothetical protein
VNLRVVAKLEHYVRRDLLYDLAYVVVRAPVTPVVARMGPRDEERRPPAAG